MKKYIFFLALLCLLTFTSCAYFNIPAAHPAEMDTSLVDVENPDEPPFAPDPRLPDPNPAREDDHTLRLSMRPPLTLNPLFNQDETVARVLDLIFEPLAVLDENMRPVGHLADIEFALDFSTAVVVLNNAAIWSDGLPVSSDDLIFSVETLRRAPEDAIYRQRINNIADIRRVDERTAHITFENATPAAGYALLFPLIPQHYYRMETYPASPRNLSPLGNGPYLFRKLVPLQSVELVRNPHTFRTRATIERVEVLLLPDAQIDRYAFDRGLVDTLRMPFPEWSRYPTAKALHVAVFPAMYFEFIGFNFTRDIFTRENVRRGIAHAFDADEAVASLYLHHAARAHTPIHPLGWLHAEVEGQPHDLDYARILLRSVPPEEPLVILAAASSPERTAIAQRLADGLIDAGLTAEAVAVSDEEFLQRLADDDYDLYIGWMELSFQPNFSFLFNGQRTGGVLFSHDPELERLFAATLATATENAYMQAISQLQQAFARRLPVIGLAFRHSALLMGTRIQTDIDPVPCSLFLHVNNWRIVSP